MNDWRILLTRPAEENADTSAYLTANDIFSYELPLIAIKPLSESKFITKTIINLDKFDAVIVVSKAAANLTIQLLNKYHPSLPVHPKWFSVGFGTGQILQNHQLPTFWPQKDFNSEALIELPKFRKLLKPQHKWLIMAGDSGRNILTETIQSHNCQLTKIILYERESINYCTHFIEQIIAQERINSMFISSVQALYNYQISTKYRDLVLFVPSLRIANLAAKYGFNSVYLCKSANKKGLLDACQSKQAQKLLKNHYQIS